MVVEDLLPEGSEVLLGMFEVEFFWVSASEVAEGIADLPGDDARVPSVEFCIGLLEDVRPKLVLGVRMPEDPFSFLFIDDEVAVNNNKDFPFLDCEPHDVRSAPVIIVNLDLILQLLKA